MHSTRTFAMLSLITLGGCIFSYDYEKNKPVGTTSSSSAASSSGNSGGVPTYACDFGTCLSNEWAHRYGAAADNQAAVGVAFDGVGNIVVAGNYDKEAFSIGSSSVDPLSASFSDGFLAWIKPDGTDAVWAGSLQLGDSLPATVEALAVDGMGNAIAVGSGLRAGSDRDARVQKRNNKAASGTSTGWIEGLGDATASAVTAVNADMYIVGTSSGETRNCDGSGLSTSPGMFIAKFTDDGTKPLICSWIHVIEKSDARPMAIAVRSGRIWITGTFSFNMPSPDFSWAIAGDTGTFLLAFDEGPGGVAKGTTLYLGDGSKIRPYALALGPTDAAGTHIILAGEYSGNTTADKLPVSTNPAAFVTEFIDDMGTQFQNKWAKGFTASDAIRATGIAYYDNRLYFTGTLGGTVLWDDASLPFADGVMHPYLGIITDLNTSIPRVEGFDVFPGFGEATTPRSVHIAASQNSVVLTGGWAHDVDFSTTSNGKGLAQAPPGDPPTVDAFVAKFALP